jgi:hypothetical protein
MVALAACTGARSPQGGTCLPFAPMKLLVQEGDEWEPESWIDEQGVVTQTVSRRAGPVARLAGDTVLDMKGTVQLTCDASLVLHQKGSPFTMRFQQDDALADRYDRIYVGDDGIVEMAMGHKNQKAPWKVTAHLPEQRRTAELLVLITMMSADWDFN